MVLQPKKADGGKDSNVVLEKIPVWDVRMGFCKLMITKIEMYLFFAQRIDY